MREEITTNVQPEGHIMDNIISCLGCDKACRSGEFRAEPCGSTEFYLWPEKNRFLIEGMKALFIRENNELVRKPVIFIDFNYHNLALFLSTNWLDNFKGSRIILLADRIMAPLAHYYFYHDTKDSVISTIIFHDDNNEKILSKSNAAFTGKITRPPQTKARLTDNEYTLLTNLYHGMPPKRFAQQMGVNVKNIYIAKLRLEHKLGVNLLQLLR